LGTNPSLPVNAKVENPSISINLKVAKPIPINTGMESYLKPPLTTFALTGRDGFVTHPCELVIVRKGYKPFPT
jgi:hypothetical protein